MAASLCFGIVCEEDLDENLKLKGDTNTTVLISLER